MTLDFSGQNLQGRSFKGRTDLMGANFSYADIRGVDFTHAQLQNANFSYAHAGLAPYRATALLVFALGLSTGSGFISAFAGAFTGAALISQDPIQVLAGSLILINLAIFFAVTIRRGLPQALKMTGVIVGVTAMAAIGMGASLLAITLVTAGVALGVAVIAMGIAATVTTAGGLAAAGAIAILGAGAGVVGAAGAVVMVTGQATAPAATGVATIAVLIAVAVAGLSASISWQALAGHPNYRVIQTIAVALAARGGTCFHKADLTDADFTQAMLKSTDFRQAILTRTCWFQAKKLDLAPVGKTYLDNPQVRQLVITGEGEEKNFDGLFLRGINLRGANLTGASFVNADLRDANLQSANLSRAKLHGTKLDGTDLTGACLVGADLEEWGITRETKLDRVQRQYIFRHFVKKRETRPEPPPSR